MTNGRRGILLLAAKVLVSAAAFAWVLHSVDLDALGRQFRDADPTWLALGIVLLAVHFALTAWRWNYVLERFYALKLGARRLCLVLGLGESLGSILPSFVGMDIVRTLALTGTAPIGMVAKAVIVDRALGLVALLLLISLAVPGFAIWVSDGPPLYLLVVVGIGGLAAYWFCLHAGSLIARIPFIGARLNQAIAELRRVSFDGKAAGVIIVSGLAMHVCSVAIFWAAACMLHGELSLLMCLLIVPTALLTASLPISLGGWGVREGTLVAGFALIGADSGNVLAASVCFGASGILSGIAGVAISPLLPGPAPARTAPR